MTTPDISEVVKKIGLTPEQFVSEMGSNGFTFTPLYGKDSKRGCVQTAIYVYLRRKIGLEADEHELHKMIWGRHRPFEVAEQFSDAQFRELEEGYMGWTDPDDLFTPYSHYGQQVRSLTIGKESDE